MALIRDFAEFWYIHLPVWGLSVVGARIVMRRAAPLIGRAWLAGLTVLLLALLVWALASFAVGRLLEMVHSAQAAANAMVEQANEGPAILFPLYSGITIGAALQNLAQTVWSGVISGGLALIAGTFALQSGHAKRGIAE